MLNIELHYVFNDIMRETEKRQGQPVRFHTVPWFHEMHGDDLPRQAQDKRKEIGGKFVCSLTTVLDVVWVFFRGTTAAVVVVEVLQ